MEASLALTAILPGAAPGADAPGGKPSSPDGGEASLFAVLAALAAGGQPAADEAAKAGAAAPVQAEASGLPAASAGPAADDLALVLVQAASLAAGLAEALKGSVGKAVSCDDAEAPPDEAAASVPVPDPSLVAALAAPAPSVPASTPAAAPKAEEAAPGVTAREAAPRLAMPVPVGPALDASAAMAEAGPPQDGATPPGQAREKAPDGQGNSALAKSAPGAASLPVRQDGAHELPATAADVAVAQTGGANRRGRDSGLNPGIRNGAESAGGQPAEPEPGKPEQAAGTPSADPAAATGAESKAVPAHGAPATDGAREDKPANLSAARETGLAEAAKPGLDPAPAHIQAHPVAHSARAAEAGPPQPLPGQTGAAVPVVSNVPLAAVPVEIGMRSLSGLSRFEIRLEPEDLGRIDVRLDIDGDTVRAHLAVDRVETLALLQRDAKTLERAFEQAGLKPSEGGLDLSLRDPQGDARGQHRGDDRRAFPDRGLLPEPAADDAPPRILHTLWRADRRLDLRI